MSRVVRADSALHLTALGLACFAVVSCANSPPPRTDADPAVSRRQTECLNPQPHPDAPKLLRNLHWVRKIPFEIHRCEVFPGGEASIRAIAARSVEKGLGCLAKLGPARREDASRLLTALLSKERAPKFICMDRDELAERYVGHDGDLWELKIEQRTAAASTACDSPNYPGVYLTVRPNPGTDEYEAIVFHEMLHWLGYSHSVGFDFTFVLDACCFPNQYGKRLDSACKLLSDNPSWLSEDYARRFTRLMLDFGGFGRIGMLSAWTSLFAQKAPVQAKINTASLFAAAMENGRADPDVRVEDWRALGLPFASVALAYASLNQLPTKDRSRKEAQFRKELLELYYPEKDLSLGKKRALILKIGDLVRNLIPGDGKRVISVMREAVELGAELCDDLSDGERDSLFDLVEILDWPLRTLFVDKDAELYERWRGLCREER